MGVGGATVGAGGGTAGGSGPGAAGGNGQPVDYGATGPLEIVVEQNVGESFRNNVSDDTETCKMIMEKLLGSNVPDSLIHYPAGMDWQLYTLFRPKNLENGRKYPVITWGDGTCSNPQTFATILKHLASHGFLVIASNYRQVGDGTVMLHAVEFILSENENAQSALYGKVDTKMIGATGHSQGSMATVTVGADERIIATVPIQGANASAIKAVKGPTFLIAGEKDTTVAPSGIESAFNAAAVPAVYGLALGADHTMPPVSPAPILGPITAWFKIHLANDTTARGMFYGDACTLCKDPLWTVKRKNL
jgi:pimeloyl-ACP methyl ester carboxylesterase